MLQLKALNSFFFLLHSFQFVQRQNVSIFSSAIDETMSVCVTFSLIPFNKWSLHTKECLRNDDQEEIHFHFGIQMKADLVEIFTQSLNISNSTTEIQVKRTISMR